MSVNILLFFKLFIIFFILIQSSLAQEKVSYDGYSLFRITPTTQSQLKFVLNLTAVPNNGLDFWLQTSAVNHSADVMVEPTVNSRFTKSLTDSRIPFKVLIADIGKVIEDDIENEFLIPNQYVFYSDYQSFDSILAYIRHLAFLYSDIASLYDIGNSFEGRPLEVLKISTGCRKGDNKMKPAIWIQGGAHAREQIGPAVVIFIAQKLSSLYYEDEDINSLVDNFDWYFLPVVNPDGYSYAQEVDRLWRKTRSMDPKFKDCVGVDPNRNWDIHWNDTGSSPKPCSRTYAGSKPFSEPETKAISEFMKNNLQGRFEMFVDFHSYSQRWLTPWGYTSKLPPTYEDQKKLAEVGTRALQELFGSTYSVGSSGNIMYTVSGGARDWVHKVIGGKYGYVVELRDKGEFGFLLPRCQILETVEESWEAIKAMSIELATQQQVDY